MEYRNVFLSFEGRMNRQPFWIYGVVVLFMANLIGALVLGAISEILAVLFGIVLIWPGLAVSVKRCHDRGKSGWFLLVGLIPVLGTLWLLIDLGFLRGTVGPNRFGDDPLSGLAPASGRGADRDWPDHSTQGMFSQETASQSESAGASSSD